jgi:voltage-gated potassium channel Kch
VSAEPPDAKGSDVGRDLLAAAYPEKDQRWVDQHFAQVSADARSRIRQVRSQRRRQQLRALPGSYRLRTAVAAIRLGFACLGIVSLVLGYVGLAAYLRGNAEYGYGFLDILYYDLQLFVLGSAAVQEGGPFPFPLEIARFLSPAVTMFAVVEAARVLFAQQLRRLMVRRQAGHVVICGQSAVALAIAVRETTSGRPAAVARSGSPHPDIDAVRGDPRDPRILLRAGVDRAHRLYAVDADDAVNVAVALAASALPPAGHEPLEVYASVSDPELCTALNARRFAAQGSTPAIPIEFFNAEELAARLLASGEIDQLVRQPRPQVVIAGMTTFGQALVIELGRRWLLARPGVELPITVVDPDAGRAVAAVTQRFPFLRSACTFEIHETDSDLSRWAAVEAGALRAGHLKTYICYADEQRALRAAFTTTGLWRGPESVLVRLDTCAIFGIDFRGGKAPVFDELTDAVRPFGVLDAVATPEFVHESLIEQFAELFYEQSRLGWSAESRPDRPGVDVPVESGQLSWADLSDTAQEEARSRIRNFGAGLPVVGCTVLPESGAKSAHALTDPQIERLARAEHERWVRERTSSGWRHGPYRDDARRVHPALAPWDELAEQVRDQNRDLVRQMPQVLSLVGMQISSSPTGSQD